MRAVRCTNTTVAMRSMRMNGMRVLYEWYKHQHHLKKKSIKVLLFFYAVE
jgi:hypothetical protein